MISLWAGTGAKRLECRFPSLRRDSVEGLGDHDEKVKHTGIDGRPCAGLLFAPTKRYLLFAIPTPCYIDYVTLDKCPFALRTLLLLTAYKFCNLRVVGHPGTCTHYCQARGLTLFRLMHVALVPESSVNYRFLHPFSVKTPPRGKKGCAI